MMNNPFLNRYDTPHGTVPFHLIRPEHYEPAIEAAGEADVDLLGGEAPAIEAASEEATAAEAGAEGKDGE